MVWYWNLSSEISQVYIESFPSSMIVNGFQLLTILRKISIINVWVDLIMSLRLSKFYWPKYSRKFEKSLLWLCVVLILAISCSPCGCSDFKGREGKQTWEWYRKKTLISKVFGNLSNSQNRTSAFKKTNRDTDGNK